LLLALHSLGQGTGSFTGSINDLTVEIDEGEIGTGKISYLLPKNSTIKNSIKSLPGSA